jgi:hypothetical protein
MRNKKKFDVKIKSGIAKEFSRLDQLQSRMDKAFKKIIEKELKKKDKKMYKGGYTVTNRFSDRMLPNKKRTTRIT